MEVSLTTNKPFSDYQWLNAAFDKVSQSFQRQKLAHGLMVVSAKQSGKLEFATQLAKSILCLNSSDLLLPACGQCKNCLLVQSNSHPDLSILDCLIDNKGKKKKSIGIDQVRQLTDKLVETAQMGGWRIAIITSVEKLTRGAFNALLKTLEEPGDKTLLLMLTNNEHRVPATIRSRCQSIYFELSEERLTDWLINQTACKASDAALALEHSLFSPFKSLEFITSDQSAQISKMYSDLDRMLTTKISPNQFVNKYSDEDEMLWQQVANFFQKVQVSILNSSHPQYSEVPKTLPAMIYGNLVEFNRAQCSGSNLQSKLQLETILIPWFELGRKIVHYSNR